MNGEWKYILNENNQPVVEHDLFTWAKWFETADRVVSKTNFGDIQISTVFLGLDHQFDEGRPILYESMVFGGKLNERCIRYSTREEAITGHNELVAEVVKADNIH
jgi:hypothetical protein